MAGEARHPGTKPADVTATGALRTPSDAEVKALVDEGLALRREAEKRFAGQQGAITTPSVEPLENALNQTRGLGEMRAARSSRPSPEDVFLNAYNLGYSDGMRRKDWRGDEHWADQFTCKGDPK